jgi:energy-converting hydrogenase Eha subunit A
MDGVVVNITVLLKVVVPLTLTVTNQFISQSTSIFNGPVIVNGTTTFNNTVIFTTTPSIPLAQHHLFVGNASNIAAEFAPSSTDGQMLTSVGPKTRTWTCSST